MHLVSESAFFSKVAGNWTARKVQKLEHEICISIVQNIRRHFHCISSEVSKTQCQRKIRNSTSIQQDRVSAYNLLKYLPDGERGKHLCLDSCRVMFDPSTSVCTWRDYLSRNAWSWCSLATPSLHSYIYTSGCIADGEFGGRVIINRFDKHCIILRMENIHPKHSYISSTQTPRLNKEEIKTHIQPYLFAGRHEVTSLSLRLWTGGRDDWQEGQGKRNATFDIIINNTYT